MPSLGLVQKSFDIPVAREGAEESEQKKEFGKFLAQLRSAAEQENTSASVRVWYAEPDDPDYQLPGVDAEEEE